MLGSRNVVPQKLPTIENCTTDSSSVGRTPTAVSVAEGNPQVRFLSIRLSKLRRYVYGTRS